MKTRWTKVMTWLAFVLVISACSTGNSPEGVTVNMAQASWETGWFQAQVYKLLLEELGYTVNEPVTLGNYDFYTDAAANKFDFWANGWFPLSEQYFEVAEVQENLIPVGYQVQKGALQGYLIDKKTAETYGITNLGALQDPEIAALFDQDGDGKADLMGCDSGWSCKCGLCSDSS